MIPILFAASDNTFTSNGLGRLSEALSCTVEETRNGPYELTMTYPITGKHYAEIDRKSIIVAKHCDALDLQPFRVYRITRPLNGVVTIYARHISYDLNRIFCSPFTATGIVNALTQMAAATINTCPFTFWTDKTVIGGFATDQPRSVRSILGGEEGSLLDVYGTGEYEWDGYTVKLYLHRGQDSGVTVRYGKNLISLTQDIDDSGTFNAVAPYWRGADPETGTESVVTLTEGALAVAGATTLYITELDMSQDFQDKPTEAQLRTAAQAWLNEHAATLPTENLTISFAQLWQANEYQDYAPLQRVKLCDTVTVLYPQLGVTAQAEVIKVKYNTLLERYDSMELGDPRTSLASTLIKTENAVKKVTDNTPSKTFLATAIDAATDLIAGGLGGHVVIKRNADGEPQEILVMDTDNISTAMNVLRINLNGIGFSTNGYNGPFSTAWTIDGHFVANFIDSGRLRAIKIQGPRDTNTSTSDPEDTQYPTFWNLADGIFQNYGEKTVTSNIYGTTTQYDVITKTIIDDGELTVEGHKEGVNEETTFADLGILANSNATQDGDIYVPYMEGIRDEMGIDIRFPRGELELRGHRVSFPCGSGNNIDEDGVLSEYAGKARPMAHYTTDKISLGLFDDFARDDQQSLGTATPARNSLMLTAGWNDYKDAIRFIQRFQTEWTPGPNSDLLKRYLNPPVIHRPSWEFAPYDTIYIEYLFLEGYMINNKKDIAFAVPLGKPISSDVVSIHIYGDIHARQGSTVLLNNASFDSDPESGLAYPTEIHLNDDIGMLSFRLRHEGNGSWSTGTNYAPVHLTLTEMYIEAYDYDYYDQGGDPT